MRPKSWRYIGLVIATLCCTGCWDSAEINQLGIATATGIELVDPRDPHGSVRAYVQVASPSQLTGPTGGSAMGDKKAYVLEDGVGPTASASLTAVQRVMSRRFFFRDRRVVVIGEHYARRGMSDLLDAMIRQPDSRFRSFLLIANGCRPGAIMRLSYPLTRLPADAMVELEESHQGVMMNAVQFVKVMTGKGDPYASGIRIVHTAASLQREMFELADVAVFRRDHMVGWLRGQAAQGFYWLQPQSQRLRMHAVSVPMKGGGWITSQLLLLTKTVRTKWTAQGPSAYIQLAATDDVTENTSQLSLEKPADVHIAEQAIKGEMMRQIRPALTLLQQTYQADCLGLGDALFATHPRQWRAIASHWRQVYSQMPIHVSVDVHVIRSGITGGSL